MPDAADLETRIGAARTRPGAVPHPDGPDVLRTSTVSGPVRRLQPQGSVARHGARIGDGRCRLVSRSHGSTADVDCTDGVAPCPTPASPDRAAAQRGTP